MSLEASTDSVRPAKSPGAVPRVSVLLPIRNGERFLRQALDSIFSQRLQDWELIAVLDGSKDSSAAIITQYGDARLKVRTLDAVGLPAALNRGLELCTAAYVARMDADDVCDPRRLKEQADFLDAHPEVGIVGSGAKLIDTHSRVIGVQRMPTGAETVTRALLWRNRLVHSSVMFRRALIGVVGGYNAELKKAEDYELWLRFLSVTMADNLPDLLVSYRRHPGQMSLTPTLTPGTIAALSRARRIAGARVGVGGFGVGVRAAAFFAGQLRWEAKRRMRLRALTKNS